MTPPDPLSWVAMHIQQIQASSRAPPVMVMALMSSQPRRWWTYGQICAHIDRSQKATDWIEAMPDVRHQRHYLCRITQKGRT
jgi:hypothetical protein